MPTRLLTSSLLAFSVALASGCCATRHSTTMKHEVEDNDQKTVNGPANAPAMMAPHENMWVSVTEAVAVIYPTKGSSVSGTLHFTALPNGGGVHIHGTITGLEPNSTHAFHIHEFGDPSAPDGMSAGGHFNPEHHKHGGPDSAEHHAGDLGNLTADASGSATIDITAPDLSIAGMKDPVIGRGVVIHAKADDLVSQPVGNAGGRIGVGTIGIAKPMAPAPQ